MSALQITDFCSYDEIRAVLGVSVKELSDATLGLPWLTRALRTNFNLLDSTVLAAFAALPNPLATADEQALDDACRQFALFQVAVDAGRGMPQFSPRTISDGKAMMQRQLGSGQEAYQRVLDGLESARSVLTALRATSKTAASARFIAPLRVAAPSTDPVTG